MSDSIDKDLTALFAAQRALDRASAPSFEASARPPAFGEGQVETWRLARRGLLVALAAAGVWLAATLVARWRHEPMLPSDTEDISRWSAPTDVLLRMSSDALQVPSPSTSALNIPTGD